MCQVYPVPRCAELTAQSNCRCLHDTMTHVAAAPLSEELLGLSTNTRVYWTGSTQHIHLSWQCNVYWFWLHTRYNVDIYMGVAVTCHKSLRSINTHWLHHDRIQFHSLLCQSFSTLGESAKDSRCISIRQASARLKINKLKPCSLLSSNFRLCVCVCLCVFRV